MTPSPDYATLTIYTAVDHVHRQGSGIGVVQQIEHGAASNDRHSQRLRQERKSGYTRLGLADQNIKTSWRAKALALIHGLSLAGRTVRQARVQSIRVRKILAFADPTAKNLVQAIRDAQRSPDRLCLSESTQDCRMIKKVIDRIRKLTHRGLEISVAVSDGEHEAGRRAKTLARQRGGKACRGRRRQRRKGLVDDGMCASESPQDRIGIAVHKS